MTRPKPPSSSSGALSIANIRPIEGVNAKVNTLAKITGPVLHRLQVQLLGLLDESLKPAVSAAYDPWYSANELDLVAIAPYKDDAFILMGSNKSAPARPPQPERRRRQELGQLHGRPHPG